MRVFLLWHHLKGAGEGLDPERVSQDLGMVFSPLLDGLPKATIRRNSAMSMVFLELPVRGWRPPFFEEDERTWALAAEYPVDARVVLEANGIRVTQDAVLLTLARSLEENPRPLLREMAPPFSLVWASKQTGETFVQNDGLGQAQLFEYQGSRLWALTNKIFALKALGVELELEPEEWAVKSTLDWFPMGMTGYKRARFLAPATQVRLSSHGVTRTTYDVLAEWVNPGPLSQADCLDLARCSLLKQIRAAMPLWETPVAELTGGWDTRAVVASLRFLGVDFAARVRGHPEHYDVIIASKLAQIAGIDLKVSHTPTLPPDNHEECKRSIFLALVWQAGLMMGGQHKEFIRNLKHFDGYVKIMGQHGEIGRRYYAKRIRADRLDVARCEERLADWFMQKSPPFLKNIIRDRVREIIRETYRQAHRYDLTGLARLDFFYLYERTRRWASAKLNLLPGVNFSPFLNPDFIRATFCYQGHREEANPFHRHIIATHAPEWAHVPTARDLSETTSREKSLRLEEKAGGGAKMARGWRECTSRSHYNSLLYWNQVGAPIIREALAEGGFWTEIFDPDLTAKQWHAAPDHLAILHLLPHVLEGHFLS